MGCFNQICMLSGLPIVYRDPVRAILVSEHYRATLGEATCDYSSKYLPRTFPVQGFYNDYGRLEDLTDDVFKRLWVQGLHTDMFELSVGENQYHDIAVTRDMDFDQLWEAIWEERLIVPGHWCYGEEDRRGKEGPPTVSKPEDLPSGSCGIRNVRVQVAMIREDVWQTVMASPFKSWREDFPDTLEKFKGLVREYWTECQVLLSVAVGIKGLPAAEISRLMIEEKDIYSIFRSIQGSSSMGLLEMKNPVHSVIRDECGLGLGSHWLMALQGAVQPEEMDEFFTGVSEVAWFSMVNGYRGRGTLWKPSYAGGQNRPWKSWLRYHRDMVGLLEGVIQRAKADDYDDEDD